MKLKIIQFGDDIGIGSIVEKISFFGKVSTWTLIRPKSGFNKWVCRETGEFEYTGPFLHN